MDVEATETGRKKRKREARDEPIPVEAADERVAKRVKSSSSSSVVPQGPSAGNIFMLRTQLQSIPN